MRGGRRLNSRTRSVLLWTFGFILATQLGLNLVQLYGRPELYDPDYAHRLALLRQAQAANPDRPLVLVVGSSRTALGLRSMATESSRRPGEPLVFNFSIPGSGPVRQLLWLKRLRHDGIRPERVVLELWPPFLNKEIGDRETIWLDPGTLRWTDLRLLRWYAFEPCTTFLGWLDSVLAPWCANRGALLAGWADDWAPPAYQFGGRERWRDVDRLGWLGASIAVDPKKHLQLVENDRQRYGLAMERFELSEVSDRAVNEMLAACRRHHIPATLLIMPESSVLRSWYPERVRAELAGYTEQLCRQYEVSLIDARAWLPDRYFADAHHLVQAGANKFSRRFAAEVLPALFDRTFTSVRRPDLSATFAQCR